MDTKWTTKHKHHFWPTEFPHVHKPLFCPSTFINNACVSHWPYSNQKFEPVWQAMPVIKSLSQASSLVLCSFIILLKWRQNWWWRLGPWTWWFVSPWEECCFLLGNWPPQLVPRQPVAKQNATFLPRINKSCPRSEPSSSIDLKKKKILTELKQVVMSVLTLDK